MSAGNSAKKTVYVDVDEEITGIIDKVRSSDESIIALVLPKRATVLQSIVNMKLVKRAADQSDKKVVLITSESTLMPLAGAAGLHVAPNLQSRPYIPSGAAADAPAASPETSDKEEAEPVLDPATPIGEVARRSDKTEPIEIDNRPKDDDGKPLTAAAGAAAAAKVAKAKKDKNKKVPNFQKFRVLLFAGIAGLILLILFGYWALAVAPKATITLRTESKESAIQARFTADTEVNELDVEESILPARQEEIKRNQSEKVAATGEKDAGTKANGTVKLRNCTDDEITIPAGTGVSNGEFTFITQSTVDLDDDARANGNCVDSDKSTRTVNVVAQKNGEQYNLSPRTYVVSGFPGVVAEGQQMNGGSSKKVKIVSQTDVDNARKRITDKQNAVVEEIKKTLEEDEYIGLVDSFSAGNPNLSASPAVGSEANEVTVSGEVTYTMLGVKESDLKKIIEEQAKDEVDTAKQSILDYGLDEASYEIGAKRDSTTQVTVKTTLVAGPELNQESLKAELAGKKGGEAESLLKGRPGITEAKVDLSPFWVGKVPGKASKVTFNIEQADGKPITQ